MGLCVSVVRQKQSAWSVRNLRMNEKNNALVIVEQGEVFLALDRILKHHVSYLIHNLPHVAVVRQEVLVGARWILKPISYVISLFSLPDFFGRTAGDSSST